MPYRATIRRSAHWAPALTPRRFISSTPPPAAAVVFSGIQPTGVPHLGNYLGALRQWVCLQDDAPPDTRLLFSVVDLHALTAVRPRQGGPGEVLRQRRRETLAALLAVGLDPERSVLFYQSDVPAHTELMWILSCTASMGYLSRMTQWKSKLSLEQDASCLDEKAKSVLKLGLFSYPVLQAADVLVHGATHVPVGDDQRQHLEFARECAGTLNYTYGTKLAAPVTLHSLSRRVMSLQQPTQKMSKSHPDPRSRIELTDTESEIRAKLTSALTDSINTVSYDPEARPGVSNLLEMWSAFDDRGRGPQELASGMAGASLRDLKLRTADAVVGGLDGIRERYLAVLSRDGGGYLDQVAALGSQKASLNAAKTMNAVRSAVGL